MPNFIHVVCEADIQGLAELASEIWHEFFPCILTVAQIDYMVEKFQSVPALQQQIAEGYQYYVLEQNGEKAGYFGVCQKPDSSLFLSKLYVKKSFRGQGLSRIAFEKICQIAKQLCSHSIWLTVNKYNTHAIQVYQRFGMQKIRSEVTDIGGGFVVDDDVYSLSLRN